MNYFPFSLRGLGHEILGDFSDDPLVITTIYNGLKLWKNLKETQKSPKRGVDGKNWRRLKRIAFG